QYTFASVVSVAWFATTGFIVQAVGASALHAFGAGRPLLVIRRHLTRVTAALLSAALLGLPVVIVGTRALQHAGFAAYAPALDIMPILYAGGALSAVSIYGYVLLALRRFPLVMMATGVGVVVALAGGFILVLGDPTIADFAWLFLASQLTTASFTIAAGEFVVRRGRFAREAQSGA
ncbi:MAG TPA: hypothetical protein VGR11_13610, partial [Solirubrobacteraceae bacterium]|nr:hypothetical protein [Solirubrobacteraceae bacterium]